MLFTTLYFILLVLVRAFSLTSSTYNSELVVNEEQAFRHGFCPFQEYFN